MRRLALCVLLGSLIACATEPERPWVVKEAITAGDLNDPNPLPVIAPDGSGMPAVDARDNLQPATLPSADVNATTAEEPIPALDAVSFDDAVLISDEPEYSELSVYDSVAEVAIDIEAPMTLNPRPDETLVRVESSVNNAEVWNDGILLGPANVFLTLDPGSHELEIRASGFSSVVQKVNLPPYAKEIIKVDLAPLAH